MSNITITMSPEDRSSKPKSIPAESSLINSKNEVTISIKEFAEKVIQPYGRSWCGARLKKERKTDNFISSKVIALDFDNKDSFFTAEDCLKRLKEQGLKCTFIYSSFSHSEKLPKFRVVFVLDSKIFHPRLYSQCVKILMNLFPECDKSAKDATRMWYGGRKLIYKNYNYVVPIDKLFELDCLEKLSDSKRPSRDLKRIATKWANYGNPLYNTIRETQNSPKIARISQLVENYDWAYAISKCECLKNLKEGKIKVWHNDLFFLASNMARIKGGEKRFKEWVKKHPKINNEKIGIMPYIKMKWNTNSPIFPNSFNNCESLTDRHLSSNYNNLLRLRPFGQYSKPELISTPLPTITLEEGRVKLETEIERVLNSKENKIYIFKCSTGLGKTFQMINKKGVAIFFPNHDLKNEKAGESSINPICTPKLDDSLPLYSQYTDYCNNGLYKKATHFLKEAFQTPEKYGINEEQAEIVHKYLQDSKSCRNSIHTIFSTHTKGLNTSFENLDTYIFDEDPLSNILEIRDFTTKDLRYIIGFLKKKGAVSDVKTLSNVERSFKNNMNLSECPVKVDCFENPSLIEEAIQAMSNKISGDIFSFLFAKEPPVFYSELTDRLDDESDIKVSYIIKKKLFDTKKYIILSANASEWIYRKLFGDRVEFIDISNIALKGKVVQFSDKSFSRSAIGSKKERAQIANKFNPELKVITFAGYKSLFDKAVEQQHFLKTEGFNSLTGQDLKVVGTPHVNNTAYILMAKALGLKVGSSEYGAKRVVVEHNGYRFNFNTFLNEDLRRIQFYFIEKELNQAIGRARLVSNENTVYVFSDYPMPGAHQNCLNDIKNVG